MTEQVRTQQGCGASIMQLLRGMQLEAAVQCLRAESAGFDAAAVNAQLSDLEAQSRRALTEDRPAEARMMARRATALRGLLAHGPDPGRMVAEVDLPEGYRGKVLMALLKGGVFEGTVCLRSGDDWHREILRNLQAELQDLGFPSARAYALGGAYAAFEGDRIIVWGTSDELGCCDKELAAEMIGRAYPGRTVCIED